MFLHFASNFRLWKKSFPLASYYFNNATPHSSHLSHFLFHFFLFFSSSLFYVPSSHHLANSFAVQTSSFSGNNNANYSHYCTSTTHCSTMQIVEYTLSLFMLWLLYVLCSHSWLTAATRKFLMRAIAQENGKISFISSLPGHCFCYWWV